MGMRAVIFFLTTFFLFFENLSASCTDLVPDLSLMIPMRDGTELPADLYFPDNQYENLPCILIRSPAGRDACPWLKYANLSKQGFLVVIQDTRSFLDKKGLTIPYLSDGWGKEQDGYDTVEWLGKSPFTSGKIGTFGFSASGITQQMLAPTSPPSLVCQYIGVAAGSIFHHAVYPGGCLLKNQVEGWLGQYAKDPRVYQFLQGQTEYNDFWGLFNAINMAKSVSVPALHYSGWFDIFIQGTIDSFLARQEHGKEGAKGKQKLIIGPWTHHWPERQTLGDFHVPANAQKMPVQFLPNAWFTHYLKESKEELVDRLPAVTYYVMGPLDGSNSSGNQWRYSDKWPVENKEMPYYLTPEKGLSVEMPKVEQSMISYYDSPTNPIPTIGGRNLFIESGPKDQQSIESREDIVLFTSKPLDKELEITGQIFLKLFLQTDIDENFIVARFCDVYPDGRSILIADGMATIKNEKNKETIQEIDVDLWSTSIVIAKGHSLRLSIAGSNYPRFEKHKSGRSRINNKIFVGTKYPSKMLLPTVDIKSVISD